MHGIFTYIWVIFRGNVGKYSIHGAYGIYIYIIYIPIGSMYAIYDNIYHQYTPVMLAYIPYI